MESLPTDHGAVPTFVALPDGGGPWPGVVVLHDAGGMTHDVREHARGSPTSWRLRPTSTAAVPRCGACSR